MLLPEGLYFFLFLLFQIACPFLQKFFQKRIDLSAQQYNVHTSIQPKHDQNNRRQTSVHTCKAFKHIKVYRKKERQKQPSACRKHRSRKLFAKSYLCHISPVRKKTVHKIPNVLIRIINSTTLLKNGMCSYIITLILFPNTDNTRELTIANRNITV